MRAVKILLAVVAIIWLLGTGISLYGVAISHPPCRAPWVTAAVLWPVIKWAPDAVTEPIMDWSLRLCRK